MEINLHFTLYNTFPLGENKNKQKKTHNEYCTVCVAKFQHCWKGITFKY